MLQPDMKLVGIVKTKPDYKTKIGLKKGYEFYAPTEKELKNFEKKEVKVNGTLLDLLKQVDVIVDASPGGVGEANKPIYEKNDSGVIFEGGEEAYVADVSFVAQCNYNKAVGAKFVRSVSCNTTGLCRTLHAIDNAFKIKRACATIVRRAVDPDDVKRGPVDAIVPDPTKLPSHHGPDVNSVLPSLRITTMALKVPTTYMHVHAISATVEKRPKPGDVVDVFGNTTRVMLVDGEDGLTSTAHLFDYARDLGRRREDLYEICVWRESVTVVDDEVFYMQAVDQEADVIPENIDAIRAVTRATDGINSIKTTNRTLGIFK